jgi:hypothetical protein
VILKRLGWFFGLVFIGAWCVVFLVSAPHLKKRHAVLLGLVQAISAEFTVIGWFFLWLPCLLRAWKQAPSTVGPIVTTDKWSWPINFIYGNPSSDGVSGTYALIWRDGKQVPYLPTAWPPWRAYLWSGWRNSTDNLKYVFRWPSMWGPPPLYSTGGGRKFGWQVENGIPVPVFSL